MKKKGLWVIILAVCLLLAGCSRSDPAGESITPDTSTPASVQTDTQTGETPVSESGSDDPEQTEQKTEAEAEDNESVSGYPVFDFESRTVLLNSGYEMPILGLGMFSLSDSEAENSTYWALKAGFRLIDTARIYGNEAAVGRGLRRAIDEGIVTREEVFITTKMWTSDYDSGDAAIDVSLERLGVEYIDLMILHHSQPSNDVDAYQAMERAVADGKLRSIGLSNYYEPEDFDRLVNATTIRPALLQNETHIRNTYHVKKLQFRLVLVTTFLSDFYRVTTFYPIFGVYFFSDHNILRTPPTANRDFGFLKSEFLQQKISESRSFRRFSFVLLTLGELRCTSCCLQAVLLNAQRTSNQHK